MSALHARVPGSAPVDRGEIRHLRGAAPYGKRLSPRQIEALARLARYHHGPEAADAMGISMTVYKNYLSIAYAKLGADGALHAFELLGWLCVPERLQVGA